MKKLYAVAMSAKDTDGDIIVGVTASWAYEHSKNEEIVQIGLDKCKERFDPTYYTDHEVFMTSIDLASMELSEFVK